MVKECEVSLANWLQMWMLLIAAYLVPDTVDEDCMGYKEDSHWHSKIASLGS